jgi:hypothetical protein
LIKIPQKYREILIGITSLSDSAIAELESALGHTRQTLVSREEVANLAAQLKSIPAEEGVKIFEALLPLYMLKGSTNKNTSEFISDVINSLMISSGDEVKLLTAQAKPLEGRLTKLLGLKTIDLSAKAMSVLFEQQRTFQAARILTDIRPVFNHDATELPTAAVLIHTLRIEYLEDEESKEFFVAMDKNDIQKLRDVLERANQKESSIKEVLSKSSIDFIELNLEE